MQTSAVAARFLQLPWYCGSLTPIRWNLPYAAATRIRPLAVDVLLAAALTSVAVLLGSEAARKGQHPLDTTAYAAPGIEVAGEAGDGAEAVTLAAETAPEVILMDIRMPGMNGIDATERILAQPPNPCPASWC